MFSLKCKIRKSYAKLIRIRNDYEDDIIEWIEEDPESFALYCHYSHIFQGGDISG